MKITTLIDNIVYDSNLTAEHGFSCLIEKDGKKILFDTGQSGKFIKNAAVIGIDVSQIDAVVLSHGHYDHTGGLMEFIKINKKAKIYLKKECFIEKYKSGNKYIGMPFNMNIFADRLIFTGDVIEIAQDVFIMPEIKVFHENDTHFKNMQIKKDSGFVQDEFQDEEFLAVKKDGGLVIISGCSHRGITNIIKSAAEYFNLNLNMVLGGFHLRNENKDKIMEIIKILNGLNVENIGVSHCTGIDAYSVIAEHFNGKCFYNYTGNILEI